MERQRAMLLHIRSVAAISKGTAVKNLLISTMTVGALATAAIGFAGTALAAPSGTSTVDSTMNALKADGYDVILNRTGAAPLSQCTVAAVRLGQQIARTDSGNPGDELATTVVSKTVYVDVAC
jgi:hypothetical protein